MTPSDVAFDQAVDLLTAGELVAFPTETVYGLGADATNPEAVAKIFAAKGRPADHPLIVHLPADEFVQQWARDIPDVAWEVMENFWPGPLTLILNKQAWVPEIITGGQDTVGLRIPGHPVALELLRRFAARNPKGGIAAPSANLFGRLSPTVASHVHAELGTQITVLDGGACSVGIESTIVDFSRCPPTILRPGHIAPAHLAAVLGVELRIETAAGAPRVSGSLPAHYAPKTPMRWIKCTELSHELKSSNKFVLLGHTPAWAAQADTLPPNQTKILPNNPIGYAQALYSALRSLDDYGADCILVEPIPETPDWSAVNDRLRRAIASSS